VSPGEEESPVWRVGQCLVVLVVVFTGGERKGGEGGRVAHRGRKTSGTWCTNGSKSSGDARAIPSTKARSESLWAPQKVVTTSNKAGRNGVMWYLFGGQVEWAWE
jgi:hypothetical protein